MHQVRVVSETKKVKYKQTCSIYKHTIYLCQRNNHMWMSLIDWTIELYGYEDENNKNTTKTNNMHQVRVLLKWAKPT